MVSHFSMGMNFPFKGSYYNSYITLILGLTHHTILGEDSLCIEFPRSTDGKEFCLGCIIARASSVSDLDEEIWDFEVVRFWTLN